MKTVTFDDAALRDLSVGSGAPAPPEYIMKERKMRHAVNQFLHG